MATFQAEREAALSNWKPRDANSAGYRRELLAVGFGANAFADRRLSNPQDSRPHGRRYDRVDRIGRLRIDPSTVEMTKGEGR